MKIIHLSDTHIGFNELDRITKDGINAREQDFYDAFSKTVDRILEIRPDAVLHTGDFFHRPSPANRPMIFGLNQLKRIAEKKIPFYVIAGNHETPRTSYSSPILEAFKTIDYIFPVYGRNYEIFNSGDLMIHAVPHINDEASYSSELEKINITSGKLNILMLHTTVGKDYMMDEYGEKILPQEMYDSIKEFDYTALGHWHNFQQIKKAGNAWYSGSTERLSEKEADRDKGFITAEFSGSSVTIDFEKIPVRTWKRFDISSCSKKSVADIKNEIAEFSGSFDSSGAIISINFYDIKPEQSIEISNRTLTDFFNNPLIVIPRRYIFSEKYSSAPESSANESLDNLFNSYLRNKSADETEFRQMKELSDYYFSSLDRGQE